MTTVLAFIIIIGVLITIHEFGHFIAARSVGVKVERFSVGVPPRFITVTSIDNGFLVNLFFFKNVKGRFQWQPILSKKILKYGRIGSNTEYVFALLPLGGYVKMAGMIDESLDTDIQYKDHEFMSKSLLEKIWILSAGVIMNTLLAFVIFSSIVYDQGKEEVNSKPIIGTLKKGMPAKLSGLLENDKIIQIDGVPISTWEDLSSIIKRKPNTEIELQISRENQILYYTVATSDTTIKTENGLKTIGLIGIAPELLYSDVSLLEATYIGLMSTIKSFSLIVESLAMLGSGAASIKDLGGPIMIAQLAGQTAEAGIIPFLTFMALLSVNLALLNILPIPGLDGGHIFIHLIEGIIRRPLTLKTRVFIQQIGMALLLMLMVTVIFQDITRLFN
tara:strand:+ start:323 stop:1492 length:1170 start_codon:yes stop_codon:yes gene_type:complete